MMGGFCALAEIYADMVVGMFSFGRWCEVFDTIKRNKLRTALTAVSVAWGIFVMVALLGMGRGLNQGIRYTFRREAQNAVYVSTGKTSIAYGGYNVGLKLTVKHPDYRHPAHGPGIRR